MTTTRLLSLISGTGQIEEALLCQRAEIADRAQRLDDTARRITRAIGIGDRRLRPLARRGDGGGDGAALSPARDHRLRPGPALLAFADIDRGRPERRRLEKTARRIADDRVRLPQQVQIKPRAQRPEESRL